MLDFQITVNICSDECLVLDQYGTAWEPASSMNVARNEHGLDAVGENLVATGGYGEER